MIKFIPLSVGHLNGREWKYVKNCLDTGWVSSVGAYVTQFEQALAKRVGGRHAVACVNGTGALHMAYHALGIGPGDEVIMPALTFVAPANAARYVGAYPVFVDVDERYWQMDVAQVEDFLKNHCRSVKGQLINKHTRRQVKAITIVHLLGQAAPVKALTALARKFSLKVIEDVAEAAGASASGKPLGSFGDAGCFSFNGNKTITCGGGGMVVVRTRSLAERIHYLTTQAKDDELEYIHHEIGYNYRLTNVQAAIGLAQVEQLDDFIKAKKRIAAMYHQALLDVPGLTLPQSGPWSGGYWWLYTILVDEKKFGMSSRQLLQHLGAHHIQARPLWHPLHGLKPFADCYAHQIHSISRLYKQALSLPSSVNLTAADQQKVIGLLKRKS